MHRQRPPDGWRSPTQSKRRRRCSQAARADHRGRWRPSSAARTTFAPAPRAVAVSSRRTDGPLLAPPSDLLTPEASDTRVGSRHVSGAVTPRPPPRQPNGSPETAGTGPCAAARTPPLTPGGLRAAKPCQRQAEPIHAMRQRPPRAASGRRRRPSARTTTAPRGTRAQHAPRPPRARPSNPPAARRARTPSTPTGAPRGDPRRSRLGSRALASTEPDGAARPPGG
jgi:hypothetical protein